MNELIMILLIVLLTMSQIQSSFSCNCDWFGLGCGKQEPTHYPPQPPQPTLLGKGKNDHNLYRDQDHWKPSEENIQKWTEWYQDWVVQQRKMKERDQQATSAEGSTDSNQPQSWYGLPPGRGAQDPPPWAVIPNSYGKPHFCFLPPLAGHCSETLLRWGFNPYEGECQNFNYTGCGGNDNNFLNQRRCLQACLKLASSLCVDYANRRVGTILVGKLGC